ncbi:MAG: YbjQ family protein [Bacteroidales bacterium]|nr:YbjQ family protein [Bacteroidales bacterium]
MKLYSVENLNNVNYEPLGIVSGSTIQSKNVFSDLGQSLKNIVGGELKAYTRMMEKARESATERMIAHAQAMGADAIIGVRYTTSAIMAQAAEVLVYGTAIKTKN